MVIILAMSVIVIMPAAVQAASGITWGSATTIVSEQADISTSGTLAYAYNAGPANGTLTLNGVPFTVTKDGLPTPGANPDITADSYMNSSVGFGNTNGLSYF